MDTFYFISQTDRGSDESLVPPNSSRRRRTKPVIRNNAVKNRTGKPETEQGQLKANIHSTPAYNGMAIQLCVHSLIVKCNIDNRI